MPHPAIPATPIAAITTSEAAAQRKRTRNSRNIERES